MKKFSEAVLAKHKHMSHKASPFHAHSQGLEYTPSGKEVVRPIDTADAGYGGEAVSDAEGGEANAGIASKKAVSPMPMPTLVKPGLDTGKKKMKEGFDPSSADIAKELVAKHGKNVTKDHIRALEQDRDSNKGLDHDEIMKHVKKLQEETERERLMKLRSFAAKNRREGLGKAMVEEEQTNEGYGGPFPKEWKKEMEKIPSTSTVVHKDKTVVTTKKDGKVVDVKTTKNEDVDLNELKKSTLASYAKKAADEVSYHSFTAGTMSHKDPERLATDKMAMKRQRGVEKAIDKLAKEEVELDERNMENKAKKDNVVRQVGTHALIKHGMDAGSAKMTGRKVMSNPKFSSGKVADMYRKLPTMKEENDGTEADAGEYGYEGDMAMSQLKSIIRNAKDLHDHMEPQTDLPEWLQSKITLAADYIQTAADYWRSEKEEAMTEGKMKDIATNKAEDERLAKLKAMAKKPEPKAAPVPRVGPMDKVVEEEVWDKPMPDSKKQGSLSPEQKAKAKARAERAGRSYPNMIDNMWASKQ